MAQPMAEPLVAHGLGCLAPQASNLAGHFADDVRDPGEVLLRQGQLVHGLAALAFVPGDARGLLEDGATVLRLGGEDEVDLALGHYRVARSPHPGVHEKLLYVLQPAGLAIEIIFPLSVAVAAPHDLDFVEIAAQLLLAFDEIEGNLANLGRLAGIRALENDVLHFSPAQRLGALLAQHPADGIGDVGLPAAIRADDRGHARFETESGGIGERFESMERDRLKVHVVGKQ